MRILRLDLGRSVGTLDLHPFVTVISDLSREQGDAMAEAVRGIVRGSTAGFSGLVENKGELLELGGQHDNRLGILTTEDIIFGLHELAGDPASVASLEAERDQLRRKADLDAVFVEQVRADLDPSSAAQVFRLREALEGNSLAGVDSVLVERADVVREALSLADTVPPTIAEAPEPIRVLMASWDEYSQKRDQAKRHLSLLNDRVVVCERALTEAMDMKVIADREATPIVLSVEEDTRLDDLANPAVSSGRRRKKKAEADQEAQEIAELLAKAQQPSYTAYVMHRVNPAPPPGKMDAVVTANHSVERAEAALHEARAEVEIDPVASELEYELHTLREGSREYLGAVLPDDLGAGLASIVDHSENPEWVEALAALYDALSDAGATISEDLDPADLPTAAVDWLMATDQKIAAAQEIDPITVQAELDEAEKAFRRHAKSMAQIDRFEARSDESARRCAELSAQIERLTSGTASNADQILATLRPSLDRMIAEAGVPVPVIVWGELEELADEDIIQLFEGLEALSQQVQIVYVADGSRILNWVKSAGLRRAMHSTVVSVRA